MQPPTLKRGDHVCALYSTKAELVEIVVDFLIEGLRHRQRVWFITPGDEVGDVDAALRQRRVDVDAETARGSLLLLSGADTYIVHGSFDPERAIKTFNDAIESAYGDGFTGFRAVAEMSWAMQDGNRMQQLIIYEALLRTLFSTARATGMCLYDRMRTPLDVVNGALSTHPLVRSIDGYGANPFYDPSITRLAEVDGKAVSAKIAALEGKNLQ